MLQQQQQQHNQKNAGGSSSPRVLNSGHSASSHGIIPVPSSGHLSYSPSQYGFECVNITTEMLRDLSSVNIDHIVELQMLAFVLNHGPGFSGSCTDRRFISFIIDFFNDPHNLSVRPRPENSKKGQFVHDYLQLLQKQLKASPSKRQLQLPNEAWKFLKEIKRTWIALCPRFLQLTAALGPSFADAGQDFAVAMDWVLEPVHLSDDSPSASPVRPPSDLLYYTYGDPNHHTVPSANSSTNLNAVHNLKLNHNHNHSRSTNFNSNANVNPFASLAPTSNADLQYAEDDVASTKALPIPIPPGQHSPVNSYSNQ
eukprot:ANDGO_01600.mRNA.1 hypothetical protein